MSARDLMINDNANSFQATTLTTLNNIPTNANVRIEADTHGFNLYNQTKLNNAILYSQLETTGYTQLNPSSDSTNVVIQFANTNWVNTNDYYIMAPVTLSVTTRNHKVGTTFIQTDPILINNPAPSIGFAVTNGYTEAENLYTPKYMKFSEGVYNVGGLLNCFSKIECVGGTNNQQLGRATMYPQPYLSMLGCNVKVDEQEALIRGRIGLPISHSGFEYSSPGNVRGVAPDTLSNADHRTLKAYFEGFEALIRQCSSTYGGTPTATDTTTTYKKTFYVAIPLRMISEFYQIGKVLPPEFKHRITLQIKKNPTFIYGSDPSAILANLNTWTATIDPSAIQLYYMSQTLTPTLQEQVNIKWTNNPFVYDIMTNDPYVFQSYPYQQTIVTSYTRPNTIAIFVVANADKTYTAAGGGALLVVKANTISPWLAADGSPVTITRIRLTLSGRTPIDIDDNLITPGQYLLPGGHEQIINQYQNKSLLSITGPYAHTDTNSGSMNAGAVGKIIYIPFTPSMMWDMQDYPVDMGSVQLRLEVLTDKPLDPTNLVLNVNKTVVDQLTLDTNNKISIVSWPKRIIQTGSSTELLNKTVVPAN